MDLVSETASNNEITDSAIAAVPITSSNVEVTTSKLKITIKTPTEEKDISIDGSPTVKQLKDIVSNEFNISINPICLIYLSKILKDDDDNINKYDIQDVVTINLIIRALKTNITTTTSASTSSTIPKGTNDTLAYDNQTNTKQSNVGAFSFGLGLTSGMENFNFANTNFLNIQQQQGDT